MKIFQPFWNRFGIAEENLPKWDIIISPVPT